MVKWGGYGLLVIAMVLILNTLKNSLIEKGRNQVISEYNEKSRKFEEDSRREIIRLQNEYSVLYDRIDSQIDTGDICPISGGIIDGLPNPKDNGE